MKEAFKEVAVPCGSFPGIGLMRKFCFGIRGFKVYGYLDLSRTIKGKAPRPLKPPHHNANSLLLPQEPILQTRKLRSRA